MGDIVEINQSKIKVAGVGGLGMLAMVGVVAYALPQVRPFLLLSYGAGALGAFAFIAYRRWITPDRPHQPTLMSVHDETLPGRSLIDDDHNPALRRAFAN